MRISDFITEAPISNFAHVGDWDKNSSYGEQDRKLLTNPKAISKIERQWMGTKNDFNFIFVNHADAIKTRGELGAVEPSDLDRLFPRVRDQITIDENAVNVVFVNNRGDQRVPMTGWIIAHRLAHVFARSEPTTFDHIADLFAQYVGDVANGYSQQFGEPYELRTSINPNKGENYIKAFYTAIGTMKSAKSNNLRNSYEFYHELFAQYIITGGIKFNDIPEKLKIGRTTFGYKYHDLDYYNGNLESLAETLSEHFAECLDSMVGGIYVM